MGDCPTGTAKALGLTVPPYIARKVLSRTSGLRISPAASAALAAGANTVAAEIVVAAKGYMEKSKSRARKH